MRGEVLTQAIEAVAPAAWAMSYDNVGWQIGGPDVEVAGVLVALDVTLATAREAKARGANLLITHHPLLFQPVKRIDPASPLGELLTFLIREGIWVYSAHTNLDRAREGTSWALAAALGLQDRDFLEAIPGRGSEPDSGWGCVGALAEPQSPAGLVRYVIERLGAPDGRLISGRKPELQRVAVLGGSGSGLIPLAAQAADAFVTSDVRYHQAQEAEALGLTLVDVSHFYTERPLLAALARLLEPVADVPVLISTAVTCPFTPLEEVS